MTFPSPGAPAGPAPAMAGTALADPRIRAISPADVPRTVELIMDLAIYEKMPEHCHITAPQLHAALFTEHPAVFGLAAFTSAGPDARQVGYALYFLSFSTWEGVHGIYLEDLYVTPDQRGTGLGNAMLTTLARTAVASGYARVEWSVLDWNTPSIDFYRALGAVPIDGWTKYRLAGEPLSRLSGR